MERAISVLTVVEIGTSLLSAGFWSPTGFWSPSWKAFAVAVLVSVWRGPSPRVPEFTRTMTVLLMGGEPTGRLGILHSTVLAVTFMQSSHDRRVIPGGSVKVTITFAAGSFPSLGSFRTDKVWVRFLPAVTVAGEPLRPTTRSGTGLVPVILRV